MSSKLDRKRRAEYIRFHFRNRSLQVLASELGITKTTVSRIAASLGLVRSRQEMKFFNVRQRTMLVKRERRRIIFGMNPVSDIKVVTNRKRITLRYRLKKKGYIPAEQVNVMYYTDETVRRRSQEILGESLGLHFFHISCMDDG